MSIDIIKWIKGWRLDKVFANTKKFIAKSAVAITEAIKTAATGTLAQSVAQFVDETLKSHIAEDALQVIQTATLKALAVELAIEGLPDNPTGDDLLKFENEVYTAITGLQPNAASKLWTTLAAQIYDLIHAALQQNNTLTFAQIVSIVEESYQDYLKDKAELTND